MSFISTNSTYKQNAKNDLSFYHGFSKTPVEANSSGNAVTSLGNASTKAGHTVMATDVWAKEIPWYGLVPSKAVAVTRLSGLCKKNDLVKVNNDQTYIYVGDEDATFTVDTWSNFWTPIVLSNGTELKNRNDETVLRYYEKQVMQDLTGDNNAAIDSKGLATRLFVDETTHTGKTEGGVVVSQFAAGTDNIKNGIPSVELNPVLYVNGTQQVAGTDYYDYNVSGTVLWKSSMANSTVTISCFRYIGAVVTESISDLDTRIKNISVTASGGLQGVSSSTKTLGFDVKWYKMVDGVETETTSDDADAKPMLVAVSAAVDAEGNVTNAGYIVTATVAKNIATKAVTDATLASNIEIADIADGDGTNGGKLVSASQVKTYVSENAKVSVSADNSNVPAEAVTSIKVAGNSGSDVVIATAKDTAADPADGSAIISVSATLNKATVNSGVIDTSAGNGDKVVSATNVKAIADKSASDAVNAIAATGIWGTESSQHIKVALDYDNGTNKLVVTASDIASAASLSALDTKVTNHIADAAKLSIIVASGTGEDNHPDVAEPSTNKIYLVPDTNAESGSYIEWIYVEKTDGTKGWESIGSTKTDLSDYATKGYADQAETDAVNTAKTYTNEQIAALSADGGAIKALDTRVTTAEGEIDALQTAVTTLQGADTVAGSVAEAKKAGTDAQAAVDALEALVGETDVATQITNSINELNAINIGTGAVKVTQENGKVVSVTTETAAITAGSYLVGNVSSETALVTAKEALAADKIVKDIAESKISSVETDTDYFGSSLATTDGTTVTIHPAKEWEIGNKKPVGSITSVIDGKASDGSVIDIANLTNGTNMFAANVNLTTFVGDMSKLTNGSGMFSGCTSLTTFCGDLSSLTDGTDMFKDCMLDLDSVMFIVDSLPVLAEGGTRTITIGVDETLVNADELTALAASTGWTIVTES